MKVKVELEVDIDVDATPEQIEEFMRFEFHYSGQCSGENPCLEADYEVTDFYCDIEY